MDGAEALSILKAKAIVYDVGELCAVVLDDPRFVTCSGSSSPNVHHYGEGGLAVHTLEGVELCLVNNTLMEAGICEDSMFLAALFYDAGKMWDYELCSNGHQWRCTEHKRRVHHLNRSVIVWNSVAGQRDDCDLVTHAILAHHQLPEWGSPVQPQTRMAWMLHLCDCMSARICDTVD